MSAEATGEAPRAEGLFDEIRRRHDEVEARVVAACERAGRDRRAVRVVAVTKTHPPEVVRALLAVGVEEFGENRVRELLDKRAAVPEGRWHFIGRLQTNKVRQVVGRRVLVHSVDRPRLVRELTRRAQAAGSTQRVLIQVGFDDDPDRSGCASDDALDLVAYARQQPNLSVEGLMTIPPEPAEGVDPQEAARPYFAALRDLRDRARERWPEVAHLSMGMSNDLEAAIMEGATIIRVGTALTGPRRPGPWRPAGGNA